MKSRLGKSVFYEDNGSFTLTVWGDLIDLIEECKTYKFHFGIKELFWIELINYLLNHFQCTSDAGKVIPVRHQSTHGS